MRDHDHDAVLAEYFGSLDLSMLSLFMSISGGFDWRDCLDPLRTVTEWYVPIFVGFITFVVFGVMNILTSVFIEASSRIIEVDWELVLHQSMSEETHTIEALKKLFYDVDVANTGNITRAQLDEIF